MIPKFIKPDRNDLTHHGLYYLEWLRNLSDLIKIENYLEVGSRSAEILEIMKSNTASINPKFNSALDIFKNTRTTSVFAGNLSSLLSESDFWAKFSPSGIDICFIDISSGLEDLLSIFINIEGVLRQDSVIIMNGCLPTREDEKLEMDSCLRLRSGSGAESFGVNSSWKILWVLKSFRPSMNIVYIDCLPAGLVCCTNLDPSDLVIKNAYNDIIVYYNCINFDRMPLGDLWNLYPMYSSESTLYSEESIMNTLYRSWTLPTPYVPPIVVPFL